SSGSFDSHSVAPLGRASLRMTPIKSRDETPPHVVRNDNHVTNLTSQKNSFLSCDGNNYIMHIVRKRGQALHAGSLIVAMYAAGVIVSLGCTEAVGLDALGAKLGGIGSVSDHLRDGNGIRKGLLCCCLQHPK